MKSLKLAANERHGVPGAAESTVRVANSALKTCFNDSFAARVFKVAVEENLRGLGASLVFCV